MTCPQAHHQSFVGLKIIKAVVNDANEEVEFSATQNY